MRQAGSPTSLEGPRACSGACAQVAAAAVLRSQSTKQDRVKLHPCNSAQHLRARPEQERATRAQLRNKAPGFCASSSCSNFGFSLRRLAAFGGLLGQQTLAEPRPSAVAILVGQHKQSLLQDLQLKHGKGSGVAESEPAKQRE